MGNIQIITDETVVNKIFFLRGKKVMLDEDLALLYDVETRRLNEQVKRNTERFPEDFMFQLTQNEMDILMGNLRHQDCLKSDRVGAEEENCLMYLQNKVWRCYRVY